MLTRYESFLTELDKKLEKHFAAQKEYIKCKKGCSKCCEIGEYPFSRLEAEYIMQAFVKLPVELMKQVKKNIRILKSEKEKCSGRFNYRCPFLAGGICAVYNNRGIVCRTHGLAYLDKNISQVKLPECSRENLNYSEVFNQETGEVIISDLIKESLRTDDIFKSEFAEKYELECGQIRPLIDWF